MIREIRDDFIPVSVPLPLLILPGSDDPESRFFQALYGEREGAQGFCTTNAAGKLIRWLPLLEDKDDFLTMLRADRRAFDADPEGVGAQVVPPPHAAGTPCPLNPPAPMGMIVADLLGRSVDTQGAFLADTATQRGFASQTFGIPFSTRIITIAALQQLISQPRVKLPEDFTDLVLRYAYMGVEDFRPYKNPLANRSEVRRAEFWAAPCGPTGRYRVEGETDVSATGDSAQGNAVGFVSVMKLRWQGFIELRGDQEIVRLLLLGRGSARLQSEGSRLPGPKEPGARRPIGTPDVDFSSDVRLGIIAPGHGRLRDLGPGNSPATGAIQRKFRRLQSRIQGLEGGAVDLEPFMKILETVEPLMWKGEREKVEKLLDDLEKMLDRAR